MFGQINFSDVLIFVIPGFITVWSFRNFTHSKKTGDFEYFGLSIFWGLVMVLLNSLIAEQNEFEKILGNPIAAAIAFSVIGASLGVMAAFFTNKLTK